MSNGISNQVAGSIFARVPGALTRTESLLLAGAGIVAACMITFSSMTLRIPGHAILKAALPLACGIAIVPKPLAGTIASSSGILASGFFLLTGFGHGSAAAMVSLIAFGPAIDLGIRKASGKWNTVLRLAVAGAGANLLAFGVRWSIALFQNDLLHSLTFRQFLASALISFILCGLAAGALAGILYSCLRSDSENSP